MNWKIKAVVQGALAHTPGGVGLNERLQRLFGERKDSRAHIDSKVQNDWLLHMSYLQRLGFKVQGRHLLEIGSGWLPILPLCFVLAGVSKVTSVDLSRHLRFDEVRQALEHLQRHLAAIANVSGQPLEQAQAKWQALMAEPDGAAILAKAGIEYHAPADATRTGLPDASIDMVFSNSVLEHVPPTVLDAMMRETRRLLRADGIAMHGVNCGDHYAYFDKSITAIHYLRYSAKQWRWWNNDVLYQNRLRPMDFLACAERAGLTIAFAIHQPKPALLAKLAELPIADEFKHYSAEQLCCTSIDFIARLPQS